jgi:multiple sugar transport system ATP-binding protein
VEWTATLERANLNESVVLGVRSEDVSLASEADTLSLPAEVYVAEALGNETLVRLRMDGQELVARAGADYDAPIGSHLWVRPNLARAHLFDAATQQRII